MELGGALLVPLFRPTALAHRRPCSCDLFTLVPLPFIFHFANVAGAER